MANSEGEYPYIGTKEFVLGTGGEHSLSGISGTGMSWATRGVEDS